MGSCPELNQKISSLYETKIQRYAMPKTILLIALAVAIGIAGFGVYSISSPGYFIENYSTGYPRSSEIPLYEGDSSPNEIPEYENDVGITLVDPNK